MAKPSDGGAVAAGASGSDRAPHFTARGIKAQRKRVTGRRQHPDRGQDRGPQYSGHLWSGATRTSQFGLGG